MGKISLSSPDFHVISCALRVNITQLYSQYSASWRILQFPWYRQRELSLPAATVTTPSAQAAIVYGLVSMSARLGPWGSDTVEITTRKIIPPGSTGLAQAHPLTKPPAMRKLPSAGLGTVTVHPMRSGVGLSLIFRKKMSTTSRALFLEG